MNIEIPSGKKVYFISDAHLGAPDHERSLIRERRIISWIDGIERDCHTLFILGDLLDFWFEYKRVVPKGFIRILGRLASLADRGTNVVYFTGNHDMWMKDYFHREIGVDVYHEPIPVLINGMRFYIGHGDGLGPGDHVYKITRRLFKSTFARWLFARLHPNFGVGFAKWLSSSSRKHNNHNDSRFLGEDREFMILFAKEYIKTNPVDYFVFGHRHYPIDFDLGGGARFINLGDWLQHYTYAVFDGSELSLCHNRQNPD